MNQLEALRIFCAAAETGNFRQTALALGISPQVVTRAVQQLEDAFGEMLFIRNTRSTRITPFGEQLHAEAHAALAHTDALFQRYSLRERTTEAGLVRVDTPLIDDFDLLPQLLKRLQAHPGIVLDWRSGNRYSQTDVEQIDVGVRVGPISGATASNDFIVKPIAPLRMQTVMAPTLIERLGKPRNVTELRTHFPLVALINHNSGRLFEWDYPGQSFVPESPAFIAHHNPAMLQAVLVGVGVGQLPDWSLRRHLQAGRLVRVLPRQEVVDKTWRLHVYRPRRHQQTARVKRVFDLLVEILEAAVHPRAR